MTACAWIGNGRATLKPVCCNSVVPNRSYCKEHIGLVYKEGSSRARRVKDERVAAAVWDLLSEFNAAIEELEAEGFDVHGDSEKIIDT